MGRMGTQAWTPASSTSTEADDRDSVIAHAIGVMLDADSETLVSVGAGESSDGYYAGGRLRLLMPSGAACTKETVPESPVFATTFTMERVTGIEPALSAWESSRRRAREHGLEGILQVNGNRGCR
jgi:hypothetical protein